jgi:hypothetical protein
MIRLLERAWLRLTDPRSWGNRPAWCPMWAWWSMRAVFNVPLFVLIWLAPHWSPGWIVAALVLANLLGGWESTVEHAWRDHRPRPLTHAEATELVRRAAGRIR